ncbi:hypothetical protein FrEUN1fDRAFT_2886 [Parafrankia sp. EUN1f]|nr:hypothetical protein FrEUN1fDRAFT_2886 [Parafrankia sp. EUN1f]
MCRLPALWAGMLCVGMLWSGVLWSGIRGAVGGSARMTCAFVPEMPNAETAARRGRAPAGQATGAVSSSRAPPLQSTCGVGR